MAKLASPPEPERAAPKALLAPPAAEALPPNPPPRPLPKPPPKLLVFLVPAAAAPPNALPKTPLVEDVEEGRPAKGDAEPLPVKLNVGGEASAGAAGFVVEADVEVVVAADAPPSAPKGEAEPEDEPNRDGLPGAPPARLPNGEAVLVSLAKPDEAKAEGTGAAAVGLSSLESVPDEELSAEACGWKRES